MLAGFPKARAGGGSGFTATHPNDQLTYPNTNKSGLLGALISLVNRFAFGGTPASVSRWFSGAPLTPLRERDNGVRPIAVGETLRRIIVTAWMVRIKTKAIDFLQPL